MQRRFQLIKWRIKAHFRTIKSSYLLILFLLLDRIKRASRKIVKLSSFFCLIATVKLKKIYKGRSLAVFALFRLSPWFMNLIKKLFEWGKKAASRKKNPPGNNALELISFHAGRKQKKNSESRGENLRLIGIKLFFIRCETQSRKFILTSVFYVWFS